MPRAALAAHTCLAAGADASSEAALVYARLAVLSAASLSSEPSSEVPTTM